MRHLIFLLLWCLGAGSAWAAKPPAAAIASAHPLATAAGHEILAQGGNAFDAAVAIAAALAVVEPYGSGLGGGGFWLLQRAGGAAVMVDARERAPLAAQRDMYLDDSGKVMPQAALDGALAAGIPGTPAALAQVAQRYGRLPFARTLAPAIRLARDGFALSAHDIQLWRLRERALRTDPAAAAIFLERGFLPAPGLRLVQRDLAVTLERLAREGARGFYAGPVAARLVAGVRAGGGIWALEDLAAYRVREREPVTLNDRGLRITTASLPSSGGIVLGESLHLLAGADSSGVERVRTVIEAMRLAYRDRAEFLGDPDFVAVDTQRLLSPAYAAERRAQLRLRGSLNAAAPVMPERENTTHFSVLDRDGNRAAVTLSLNGPFGAAFVPPGTGVLLNNEMDDFVAKPGVPNLYGLVGSAANAIAPGKRPLSSMTPTFVEADDALLILGTPGGSRIISMVLLATLDFAAGERDVARLVARPRLHHQYLPDQVEYEPGALSPDALEALRAAGYRLVERTGGYGNMQAILWDKRKGRLTAASDPRGQGAAQVR